ncbi:hypothetical protein NIES2100_06440 [Calothrix sp. NIES-2100]|nr:hypothetical protein NIES2100_06440 [Calothrix sp. NIES-2100]
MALLRFKTSIKSQFIYKKGIGNLADVFNYFGNKYEQIINLRYCIKSG